MAETEVSANHLEDRTIRLGPLLRILECAVCLEVVKIPFRSCHRGHSMCNKCIKALFRCPTCQAEFTTENHVIVKNILEMLPRACRYAGNGCKEFVQPEPGVAGAHDERFCGFRPISCEVFQVMTKQQHLIAHDFKRHALDFEKENSIVTCKSGEQKVIISVENNSFFRSWLDLINHYGCIFFPHNKYDALFLLKFTRSVKASVLCISFTSCFIGKPVDDVFIRVTFKEGNSKLTYALKACRDGETDQDILKESKVFTLAPTLLLLLKNNKNLSYHYKIFKKK